MLVKPRTKEAEKTEKVEKPKPQVKQTRISKNKCLCSNCHKMQTYKEIQIPIKYSFNMKTDLLIDGIERVCSVCGWHVDDIETTRINREIAENKLKENEKIA